MSAISVVLASQGNFHLTMSILSHTNVEVENQKDSLLTKGVTAISVFCHQLGLSLEFPLVGGARS